MKDSLILLSHFIKNPRQVGAVAASSKFLTKEIIKNIDFDNSKTIIELGPGLGVFTRAILKKANKGARIICMEVNEKFCNHLSSNIKDHRLIVIHSGAENIQKELKKLKLKNADCIISGLPFKNFSEDKRKKILDQVKMSMKRNGKFILFQYTNGIEPQLESSFSKVDRKFVPINLPPAFVYACGFL